MYKTQSSLTDKEAVVVAEEENHSQTKKNTTEYMIGTVMLTECLIWLTLMQLTKANESRIIHRLGVAPRRRFFGFSLMFDGATPLLLTRVS